MGTTEEDMKTCDNCYYSMASGRRCPPGPACAVTTGRLKWRPTDAQCDSCLHRAVDSDDPPCDDCMFLWGDEDNWQPEDTPLTPIGVAVKHGNEAVKHDAGKPRYSLIPFEALDGLARLFTQSAQKYDARNWEKGMDWSRVYDAMQRHAGKWWAGEDYCPEDKQHHLLSVMWCATVLYTYQARSMDGRIGNDDRPEGVLDVGAAEEFWRASHA